MELTLGDGVSGPFFEPITPSLWTIKIKRLDLKSDRFFIDGLEILGVLKKKTPELIKVALEQIKSCLQCADKQCVKKMRIDANILCTILTEGRLNDIL